MVDDDLLTTRLVETLAPELADHARVLSEFAARLMPQREAFIAALKQADTNAAESNPDGRYEQGARVWLDNLHGAEAAGAMRSYLQGVVEWSEQLASAGLDYEAALQISNQNRRALLALALKAYEPGPELQLLFNALDAAEHAAQILIAATFIQAAQSQLIQTAKLRAVGRLTGGIAHSLNNLLATILGRAQLLEHVRSDEGLLFELREIQGAARRAGENLQRVQEYTAVHADEQPVPLDVNAIVGDTVQLTRYRWRDDAEASGIVIDVVKDLGDVPPVLGRRDDLRDALVELISNGVEAMPLGGLVTLRTERVGDDVKISVTDLGEGMDATTHARAFDPFFTTKGVGHIGLGLTNASRLAVRLGGRLTMETTPGRGSTASLFLPITQRAPIVVQEPPAASKRTVNILVVDDDASLREIAWKAFVLEGHRVATAESGSDALRIFREQGKFDVLLTDLGMAGMNGMELARTLKKADPDLVIILMTGWAAELDPKKIRASGIDRAINKPFDVEQVLQLIYNELAARKKK